MNKLRLPDGTTLMHGDLEHRAPYDAKKAHEYYLRTRELKGRKKSSPSLGAIALSPAKKPVVDPKVIQRKRAEISKRISAIRKELADLNNRLKEKLADAKETEAKEKRGPTAAEKAESARDSKKYRDKNKQKLANKAKKTGAEEKKPQEDTVESLKSDIAKVQGRLNAAKQKLAELK